MSIKEIVVGGVITLTIGGAAYTVNQQDVVDNFASDTGYSQQEAQEYVESIDESELESFDKIGNDHVSVGNDYIAQASTIDCTNYEYEWETYSLTCSEGKLQLTQFGRHHVALGNAYISLTNDAAGSVEMRRTINAIDTLNTDFSLPIVVQLYTPSEITEIKNTNSYNKALIQSALDAN